ncbi:bifunctional folylpolyglutamate synthase/dihydrofolate synthase [Reichenbachiella versicolor]|uniref:bifunctional folylpolyglutamate synthase/dihydrofolate synthase n=1 Tax=Reichenbachiella versicolor TaxID=1821036 RepID=UPI000D6E71BD|nr:folylpolyglutamate synthase/dihydrofolate synthase family protein [Reichenbachiella versicolor]
MNYQEVLNFLYTQLPMYQKVGKSAFNKDLSKTIELLSVLNNPHHGFKSIHIAGTNGKGSVTHMLASILQESGYKTGIYTSPHLKSFTERIKINGVEIEEDYVVTFVEKVKNTILKIEPSFFEITVAMAYSYFKDMQIDIAIIETGLGGRLDSTNVIYPDLSIITSIGLDHQDILGDSLAKIAKEKAGIIKQNTPLVIGDMELAARDSIISVAREKECKVFDFQGHNFDKNYFSSDLKGAAYEKNIDTVLMSIEVLNSKDYVTSDDHISKGLLYTCKNTGFKGRWQKLSESPLIFCDIGHNEQAITSMREQIDKYDYETLHVVWGMSSDKSVNDVIALMPKSAVYYFCAADIPRAIDVVHLSSIGKEFGLTGQSYKSVHEAINSAKSTAGAKDMIIIGGSTFVVAEIEDL